MRSAVRCNLWQAARFEKLAVMVGRPMPSTPVFVSHHTLHDHCSNVLGYKSAQRTDLPWFCAEMALQKKVGRRCQYIKLCCFMLLQNVAHKITCYLSVLFMSLPGLICEHVMYNCVRMCWNIFCKHTLLGTFSWTESSNSCGHNHRDCQGMSGLPKPGHEESHWSDED